MIIRLRGRDGVFRCEVELSDSTAKLKQFYQQQTKVPATSLRISKKPKAEYINNDASIKSLNLQHGDMIYVEYDTQSIKSQQDVQEEKKKEEKLKAVGDGESIPGMIGAVNKQWTISQYMDLVNKYKITIKHQKFAVCSKAVLDTASAQNFQQFLRDMAFQLRRVGYIYGYTKPGKKPDVEESDQEKKGKEDPNENYDAPDEYLEIYGDVIYEPLQEGSDKEFIELKDIETESTVEKLTNLLGLKRVGWVFSHDSDRDYPLSTVEILKAAEYQDKYGPHFVTITVAPTEDGEAEFEAYQVSKQCVELYKKGILEVDPKNLRNFKTKKPVEIQSKMTSEIDGLLMLTNVPIASYTSKFRFGFPPKNRPLDGYEQTQKKLKNILQQRKGLKFVEQISDFHLLLYLTNFLNISSDFPPLLEGVRTQNPALCAGFEDLVKAYAEYY